MRLGTVKDTRCPDTRYRWLSKWPSSPLCHNLMGVFLEGAQVDTLSMAAGQVLTVTYRVQVTDGQLTLSLRDLGGIDVNVVLNGLQIVWVG